MRITGTRVVHTETMARGVVIDICDGYRVRVNWDGTRRVSRTDVRLLRVDAST